MVISHAEASATFRPKSGDLEELDTEGQIGYAREKLEGLLTEYAKAEDKDRASVESVLVMVFQILVMNELNEDATEYRKLDSDRFRAEFVEKGKLSKSREYLLRGNIDQAIKEAAKLLLAEHPDEATD